MRVRTLVLGGAIGAAIAYLFDPDRGRGRRTRLRDQGMASMRRASRLAQQRGRYAASTAAGRVRAATAGLAPSGPVDDATLADRVRSEVLGDSRIAAGEINVDVADGLATLRGELPDSSHIDQIVERTRAVPGILGVQSLLHTPQEAPARNKRAAIQASERARSRDSAGDGG